jgi:hypothetical protein
MEIYLAILAFAAIAVLAFMLPSWIRLRRAEFIRTYKLPRGLLPKLAERHPGLTRKECALVSRGLRQYFLAYLMGNHQFVSMPSVIVDDLWHEFILYTREYQRFCRRAFGGFLHHAPAAILSNHEQTNVGLRRVWWYACTYENIDPVNPTRLPLLFALDDKLNIPGGFRYHPDCDELREGGDASLHCAGDFLSKSYDGGTVGFGKSKRAGGSGCGGGGCGGGVSGDAGGSCGGSGCGGGGD